MKILFVTGTQRIENPYLDHSTRYRCYHFAEVLSKKGHNISIVSQSAVSQPLVDQHDACIFHRPWYSAKLRRLVESLHDNGKPVHADFDDLIFCLDSVESSPQVRNGRMSRKSALKRHSDYQKALRLFKRVTTSTEVLAKEVARHHSSADIRTICNGLSCSWVATVRKKKELLYSDGFYIGYFPGTSSHDEDFRVVEKSLLDILGNHPEARLLIAGPLQLPVSLQAHPQVKKLKAVEYADLPALISSCHVTIAPMADTRFNRSKSNIKLLESFACGVPVVSSPNQSFSRYSSEDAIVARTHHEWIVALEKFFDDWLAGKRRRPSLRHDMSVEHHVTDLMELLGASADEIAHQNVEKGTLSTISSKGLTTSIQKKPFFRKSRKLLSNPVGFFEDSWLWQGVRERMQG